PPGSPGSVAARAAPPHRSTAAGWARWAPEFAMPLARAVRPAASAGRRKQVQRPRASQRPARRARRGGAESALDGAPSVETVRTGYRQTTPARPEVMVDIDG